MADEKRGGGGGKPPKGSSSFWTVAEAFAAKGGEAGIGFVQSTIVRGCAVGMFCLSVLSIIAVVVTWYIVNDIPVFNFYLGILGIIFLILSAYVFYKAKDIRDTEVFHEWNQQLDEERSRPALPGTVVIHHRPRQQSQIEQRNPEGDDDSRDEDEKPVEDEEEFDL